MCAGTISCVCVCRSMVSINTFLDICVFVFYLHACLCTWDLPSCKVTSQLHIPWNWSQMVVSYPVGVGNWNWVLFKSSRLLSHLPITYWAISAALPLTDWVKVSHWNPELADLTIPADSLTLDPVLGLQSAARPTSHLHRSENLNSNPHACLASD